MVQVPGNNSRVDLGEGVTLFAPGLLGEAHRQEMDRRWVIALVVPTLGVGTVPGDPGFPILAERRCILESTRTGGTTTTSHNWKPARSSRRGSSCLQTDQIWPRAFSTASAVLWPAGHEPQLR
jgi:hypothetical protein